MPRVGNPVLALLLPTAALAGLALGWLGHAPNRLLSGTPLPLGPALWAAPANRRA